MKIGIIVAMEEELVALTKLLSNYRKEAEYSRYHLSTPIITWHYGTIITPNSSVEVIAIKAGIGKAQAAMYTALLLQKHEVSYIINIGAAGGLMEDGNFGDIVIADSVSYYDVDLKTFGYEQGRLPSNPLHFPTSPILQRQVLKTAETFFSENTDLQTLLDKHKKYPNTEQTPQKNKAFLGQIVSGDAFVEFESKHVELVQQYFPKAMAVEMEAAAIAQTAFLYGCPCLIIRSISDFPLRPNGKINFKQYIPFAAANAAKILTATIIEGLASP